MPQNPIDIYNLAYYYYTGSKGYPLNYGRALEYFRQAAELGVSHAMNYLGLIYEEGKIVVQDYPLAVDWFNRAIQADSKNAHAFFNLGRMYFNGNGVAQDMERAYQLLKTSVGMGIGNRHSAYPKSCHLVGCILLNHYNNPKEAYPYFIDAAKYGKIPEAWHNLGWLAEKGVLPLKNPGTDPAAARDSLAREFYAEAVQLNYAPSMDALGRLHLKYNMTKEATALIEKAASMGYEPAKKRLKIIRAGDSGSLWQLINAFKS